MTTLNIRCSRHLAMVVGATLGAVVLTACGSSGERSSGSDGTGASSAAGTAKKLSVVASTNVWGDIVQAVGGKDVDVTSIISNPSQDPHSFEASSNTLLTISKADLVVENGGGYDDFMDRMLTASKSKAEVINAVNVSGKNAAAGEELNEHVWYDVPTVAKVADTIAETLGAADATKADTFTSNATALKAKLDPLVAEEKKLKSQFSGDSIGITEPVPLYLTEAAGLKNVTPAAFSEAIEEGDDMSPKILADTLDLYVDGKVDALVYNEQTSGPVTEKIEAAAKSAGIPVVPVTETLPDGVDYVAWMKRNLDNLRGALSE